MLSNYFTLALRKLLKNKTFSGINLFGLTLGTLCCLYILLYVQDQRNYDRHHRHADRLFRVISTLQSPGEAELIKMSTCSPPVAPALKAEFPEVESFTRAVAMPGEEQNLIRAGEKAVFEKRGYLVDSTFFEIFNYSFLAGAPATALNAPFSAVISEQLALKLFNTRDAVGQNITIGGRLAEQRFQVTGIFQQPAGKSHLESELFMTMNSSELGQFVRQNDTWAGNNFVYGYVRLKDGAHAQALEAKLPDFLQRHGAEQLNQSGMKKQMNLQPITAIHTTPGLRGEASRGIADRFLNILLIIAGFIQLVACINFMNLSTARATRRAQEVGVRKAVGAGRSVLIGQFLAESMLLAGVSIALAIPLLVLLMPLFNQLTGAEIAFKPLENPAVLLLTGGLVLLTGLLAGSYPALYLSSFQPISALRGALNLKNTASAASLRKGLVVSQFVLAILLIISALIVRLQLGYMLQKDLGFEAKQKIALPFRTAESQQKLDILRKEFSRLPEVKAAAASAILPGQMVFNDNHMYKSSDDMSKAVPVSYTYTDEHYLDALKIKLLAGRFFTPADTSSDPNKFKLVVNETTLKKLNIPLEQAPGMILRSDIRDVRLEMTIVGVMQDYHYGALSREIQPYALSYAPSSQLAYIIADVETGNLSEFLKKAGSVWRNILPAMPFEYSFLDQDFANLYQTEQTLAGIIGAFTLVAILISCLGLFGLAAFSAEQRRKEIGIRKVLGASVAGIVRLLSADFLKLVLIALAIASPIAWYFMQKWLADFAYRIEIQWWMFAAAGAAAVLIAFLTVGFQSVKAALANPVKSLQSE